MALETDDTEVQEPISYSGYPGAASGHLDPTLQNFVGNMQTDEGKDFAQSVADRIQTYLSTKATIEGAQQQGEETARNLQNMRDGLVNLVDKQPDALGLGIDLAPMLVKGVVDQHQHLDEETRSNASTALTNDLQSEIAHSGIMALARQNYDAADQAINRFGKYLPEGQADNLRDYAAGFENLRVQDGFAAHVQQTKDAATNGYSAATNYVSALMDDRQNFRAPTQWLQQIADDPTVNPSVKAALRMSYGQLVGAGEPQQSDPHVMADFIDRISNGAPVDQGEILSHMGSSLRVADAALLNHLIGPKSPEELSSINQLGNVVRYARDQIMSAGAAGTPAFGRFMSWMAPQLRAGVNVEDLLADNRLQHFAPTWQDYKQMAGDLVPLLRPGSSAVAPFGTPGVTGDVLQMMRQQGGTDYSMPGRLPVTRPDTYNSKPANQNG